MARARDAMSPTIVNRDPTQKNRLRRFLRRALSCAPKLGLVKKPDRPTGISVFIRVKDEADWIALSIASLQGFADEIIVADNGSTDGTPDLVREAARASRVPLEIHEQPDLGYTDLSNFALDHTRYSWAMNWDGDFVGHTSGEHALLGLRDRVLGLDPRRFYLIYLRLINLAGDLGHQDAREPVHFEEYLHVRSKPARFVHEATFEAIRIPKYYQSLFWYEPYVFHVNVKPARRLFLRQFWDEWLNTRDFERFPGVEDFARSRFAEAYGVASWEEAEGLFFRDYGRHLVRYDAEAYGELPELLQVAAAAPAYTLIENGGRIVGRNDVGRIDG